MRFKQIARWDELSHFWQRTIWGSLPMPKDLIPVAAVKAAAGDYVGVLFRSQDGCRWFIGKNGLIHEIRKG